MVWKPRCKFPSIKSIAAAVVRNLSDFFCRRLEGEVWWLERLVWSVRRDRF
jgi:hypothetical protein